MKKKFRVPHLIFSFIAYAAKPKKNHSLTLDFVEHTLTFCDAIQLLDATVAAV